MIITSVPEEIFRAYDIRGIVGKTLNADIVESIGAAIGSKLHDYGDLRIVVARDGRLSGEHLQNSLVTGLLSAGAKVVIIGALPTPILYFATKYLGIPAGVMITGSHNPINYNGFKIILDNNSIYGPQVQDIYTLIKNNKYILQKGNLTYAYDILDAYKEIINSKITINKKLRIVIDSGNGIAGLAAPELYSLLGCEVIPLYCKVDGNFPNHHPDPGKEENLRDLQQAIIEYKADIGLAFDGDGDRLGVIDSNGKIIMGDRLLIFFAIDLLKRNPQAKIVYDTKCSNNVAKMIKKYNGKPIMWKTGHSLIKAKMKETSALLGGEMSGHIFFKENWFGFDDALYAGALLLQILTTDFTQETTAEAFTIVPESVNTQEIIINVLEEDKFSIVDKLIKVAQSIVGKITTIDGLRIDFLYGWGVIRASNTTPCLTIRFEAINMAYLEEIKVTFRQLLKSVDRKIEISF